MKADLMLHRKDGAGNDYTITYRTATDRGIYTQPHITHRQGRGLDIDPVSCDRYGYDTSLTLDRDYFAQSLQDQGFDILDEGDHWHITYNNPYNAVTYYGSYEY